MRFHTRVPRSLLLMAAHFADLTVVIATFDSARFIEPTLASAIRCKPAAILVGDDASHDETRTIVRELAAQAEVPIVLLAWQERVGLARNWNRTIARSATTFTLKLDHDDLIVAEYVQAAVQHLREDPRLGVIAGTAIDRLHPFGLEALSHVPIHYYTFRDLFGIEACRSVVAWSPYACSSSTIYRTDVFRDVAGFDEKLTYCNDREIWFRIARCSGITYADGPGAIVRLHPDNTTKALARDERIPVEYDHMFLTASRLWPESEVDAAFSCAYRRVAKNYLGSAVRLLWRRPWTVPWCLGRAGALLVHSFERRF
mgnify:CR=1 FL=1